MRARQHTPAVPRRFPSGLGVVVYVVMLGCLSSQHVHAIALTDRPAATDTFGSEVGELPPAMTGEVQPSRLSLQLLQHAPSRGVAVAAAEMLKSALEVSDNAPLYNLFVAWSLSYKQRYASADKAEAAFVVFKASVDCLLHHNTHTPRNRADGGEGEGDSGAWYALNAFSATPQQSGGGVSARRRLLGSTLEPHQRRSPPPSSPRRAPKVSSRCPRSIHLKPLAPRLKPPPWLKLPPHLQPHALAHKPPPRLKPPPRGVRPAPAIASPPQHVLPAVTDMPSHTPTVSPSPRQQPGPQPGPFGPQPRPPGPQPHPPVNIGGPNASQAPAPPSSSGPLGPIYLAATLYRSNRVGGTPQLKYPPPPSVDWTTTGKLTPVKSQGSTCASCWANSAVSAVEAALSIAYDTPPVAYSRQILVDCARLSVAGVAFAHDDGCHGGDAADALLFMSLYSIPTEDAYPYISDAFGVPGACNATMMTLPASDTTWLKVGSTISYPANSEIALQAALAVQPVVIYWNMGYNFRSYGGGMYDTADQTDPDYGCVTSAYTSDHAMMTVGYNAPSRFWIIQNSFGTGWGEQGFIRVRMTNDTAGPCGMYWYVVAPSFDFKRVPVGFMPGVPPPSPIARPIVGCMSGVGVAGGFVGQVQATSMLSCRAECLNSWYCTYVVWDGAYDCQLNDRPLSAAAGGHPVQAPSVTVFTNPAGGTCFLRANKDGTSQMSFRDKYSCSSRTTSVYHPMTYDAPDLVLPEDVSHPTQLETCSTACFHNARCLFFMWAARADGTASCLLYYHAFTGNSTYGASPWLTYICFRTVLSK